MNSGEDLNLHEENNYSIISNDELQDFSDYSMCTAVTSSIASPYETYNQRSNQYSRYNNTMVKPTSEHFVAGTHMPQGSSSANLDAKESFRQYIDQLTAHIIKYDPDALKQLENNIARFKSGELDPGEAGRTTPLLFPEMHSLAKLDFPGLLYQLIPNILSQAGGDIKVSSEIYLGQTDSHIDDYPGPLNLERTTEDQILYYLKDQMTVELQDTFPVDWDSVQLLINYLELLIKENGKPPISNVVRLLNEGIETKTSYLRKDNKPYNSISRNSLSRASSRASSRPTSPESRDVIDPDLPQNTLDNPRGPGSVSSIVRRAVNTASSDQKTCSDVDKYREYIMSGRFEEAVNFAMRAGIWDHAFALALRMNNPSLVNEILIRFSRRAVYANDPLYTMHELMAARSPTIVALNRAFSNSEMGDWRSHLSMILAVRKYRPEEARQAIESMGEKLMLLRSFFAAHLCFLLAGTPFGLDTSVQKYRRKFELIGWPSSTSSIPAQKSSRQNCHKLFTGLNYWSSAPQQYIKLTEVYEYVLKLRGDGSHVALSVHLLPYKYMMAYRMLSAHRVLSAYEYCKDMGEILGDRDTDWLACESLNFRMVANMRDLSYQLHSLKNRDEEDLDMDSDKLWLENIDEVYCAFCAKHKFWGPRSAMPDLLGEQEGDSVSDSCSQVRRGPESYQTQYDHERHAQPASYDHERPAQPALYEERAVNGHFTPGQRQAVAPSSHSHASTQRTATTGTPTPHFQSPAPSHQWDYRRPSVEAASYQNLGQFSMPQQAQTLPSQVAHSKYPFSEIPPPSELSPEMIMTSPPRRVDIRSTSGSSMEERHDPRSVKSRPDPASEYGRPYPPAVQPQPEQNVDYDYYHGSSASHMATTMFIPSGSQGFKGSSETVDCFSSMPGYTRSRSQSNGSVGSADSQMRSGPRSRNSSESKEPKAPVVGHMSSRPLESTKEEVELHRQDKTKDDLAATDEKRTRWNPLDWFSSKQRGVHLPDDSQKSLEYDSVRNKWVDKLNPEVEKPPTPPPKMPVGAAAQLSYGSPFVSPPSLYQGAPAALPSLSKYRQATPNVKPSSNISPVLPSYGAPPAHTPNHHNDRRDYYENGGSTGDSGHPGHPYNHSQQNHSFNPNPQFAYSPQYDSNAYQHNYSNLGNR